MKRSSEAAIQACYSTWSESYYDEYYGSMAPYRAVHRDLIRRLLRRSGTKRVLDAGCGPASLLRHLADDGLDVYGFDVTPTMVKKAREVLASRGVQGTRIWEGSVLARDSFRPPEATVGHLFDAAICIGVLPHVPVKGDLRVIRNLHAAVKKNGLVIMEARNQLFALFTLNRYSYRFFLDDLIRVNKLIAKRRALVSQVQHAVRALAKHFRTDLPPIRRGRSGEPGYDEVRSRTHNPLVLKEQFAAAGFNEVRLFFYHYHCLPPMFERQMPKLFRQMSTAMERPNDWRGYFMASAFLITGKRS